MALGRLVAGLVIAVASTASSGCSPLGDTRAVRMPADTGSMTIGSPPPPSDPDIARYSTPPSSGSKTGGGFPPRSSSGSGDDEDPPVRLQNNK